MKLHIASHRPFTALDVSFVSAESAVAAAASHDCSPDELRIILALENTDGVVANFALTPKDAQEMCLEVFKALSGDTL